MSDNQYEVAPAPNETPTTTIAPWYLRPAWRRAVILCIALVVAVGVGEFVLASNGEETEEPPNERGVETQAEGFSNWSNRVYTENYNPTVRALSGLEGWQLQDLMLMLKYEWDDSANEWHVDGNRVFVKDVDGVNLNMSEVGALSKKSADNSVVYTIETPEFDSVEEAYTKLVSDVMEGDDSERISDDMVIGVACNTWDEMVLITVGKKDEPGMVRVQVFTEPAVKVGCFDRCFGSEDAVSGRASGSSVADVFQALAGRAPMLVQN